MTTLQIITLIITGTLYLIMSVFAIRDMFKGEFITKKGTANMLTAMWAAISLSVIIVLNIVAWM